MTSETGKQHKDFIGVPYRRPDTGEIVSVMRGIGDLWIAGVVKPNGSKKRVKTADVPACSDPEDCQKFLDAYAKKKGWQIHHRDTEDTEKKTNETVKQQTEQIVDEMCECGHLRSEHLPYRPAVAAGHGRCTECDCGKFTWACFVLAVEEGGAE